MKKIFVFALMAVAALTANAQNIQLHYDFGRNIYPDQEPDRQKVTVTLEQFKADPWGSWYYFVDLDLTSKFFRSAYTEISREFKLGKETPFAAHVEYNGGLGRDDIRSFQHAALLGGAYNGHNEDFSKTWSVQLLYKRFFKSYDYTWAYNSFQRTGVWGLTFANKRAAVLVQCHRPFLFRLRGGDQQQLHLQHLRRPVVLCQSYRRPQVELLE